MRSKKKKRIKNASFYHNEKVQIPASPLPSREKQKKTTQFFW